MFLWGFPIGIIAISEKNKQKNFKLNKKVFLAEHSGNQILLMLEKKH